MLAVLMIVSILASIAIPAFMNVIERSKEKTCVANRHELHHQMKIKQLGLTTGDTVNEKVFTELLNESTDFRCPDKGVFFYVDEKVVCSVHADGGLNEDEEDGGGVPHL